MKFNLYEVGGCVRDSLLGIQSKDIDYSFVISDADGMSVPEAFSAMEQYMKDNGFTIFQSNPEFYTIRAKFPASKHKNLVADFVLARKEVGYYEGTRNPILEIGTLEDDLIRRDFTINAMARDEDGNLIDLFNGQRDLEAGILRTPRNARLQFIDDPLRVIRLFRFYIKFKFKIDVECWDSLYDTQISDKLSKVVSKERIVEELGKMFAADTKASMKLLFQIRERFPHLFDAIFQSGFWLKPTMETPNR